MSPTICTRTALGTPIHRVEAVVVTKQPRPADAKEPEEAEAGEDA